ncbi:MAG: patatin-like phospholipase family protein [Frankiaceae bacterium]
MSASFVPPTDVSPSLAALPAVGSRTSTGADGSEVVGLVVAGAAARGPYAAGALTELLPALAAEGNLPTVLVGTSSGALSCALLAQFADQGERAGESLARIWRDINADPSSPTRGAHCQRSGCGSPPGSYSVVPSAVDW